MATRAKGKSAATKATKVATPTPKPRRRSARDKVAKAGRRPLLTPELTEEFVKYLSRGNFMNTTARYLGVSEATVYRWLDRGRTELVRLDQLEAAGMSLELDPAEEPYVEFLLATDKASATGEVAAEGVVISLLDQKYEPEVRLKASTWYLERRHKHWSRSEYQQVEMRTTQRIELTIEEQRERADTIVAGIVETGAIAALEAQRRLDEGGDIDDDDD